MSRKKERGPKKHTIRNEKGKITTGTKDLQGIVRNYYEELYAKVFENLGEMDTFLEKYNLPKLNENEAETLNRLITASEIEAVIKKLLTYNSPGADSFTGEFYKAFKGELTPQSPQITSKISRRWKTPKLSL